MAQRGDFLQNRRPVTFLDLFAGAGGFSEGFLQAYTDDKFYDFKLASDINENCELTHIVRYNKMLGLDVKFITQDIMEDSFLPNLLDQLGGQSIDVITGGPSCQSFSLAGRRRKLDKRDDLFEHYLKVIRALKPKYFVMENVKGILTKDGGQIKERIMHEIRSIVDETRIPTLLKFMNDVVKHHMPHFTYSVLYNKISGNIDQNEQIFDLLDQQLRDITRRIPYNVSKSDENINTVRHGLLLLRHKSERAAIRKQVIQLKTTSHIDNDLFVDSYNSIIDTISDKQIIESISTALDVIDKMNTSHDEVEALRDALDILASSIDECTDIIRDSLEPAGSDTIKQFEDIMSQIRLYNIKKPIVVLSSDYGVAQNRERVLFIGCRRDQKLIDNIPATVTPKQKVKVYEALWDLDMIGNGEEVQKYKRAKTIAKFEPLKQLREVQGKPDNNGQLFSDWSKKGRLAHRFVLDEKPFYVKNKEELDDPKCWKHMDLFNHQTSLQNDNVRKRLQIIARHGDYDEAKEELRIEGLESQKRNYVVLNPEGQSPTVCTMPDDFIHYSAYRPTTVREMARLQSFDDSFVLQGKRQTGGNNRQKEIPQYTLVGNAVPPLMARAIANEILKNIH